MHSLLAAPNAGRGHANQPGDSGAICGPETFTALDTPRPFSDGFYKEPRCCHISSVSGLLFLKERNMLCYALEI